jgi:O-acetyl-ADP-ribose deacetylase (regulator of RNase III)
MEGLWAAADLPGGGRLRLMQADITTQEVDAIVNAANARLQHGGGVAAAIVRAGGAEIQRESNAWIEQYGPISHREPALTGAGDLPSTHVIHVVGPRWGEGEEDRKLAEAVRGALDLAEEQGCESLALPAISTGIFGFPLGRAAELILDTLISFFSETVGGTLRDVRLVLIDEEGLEGFMDAFEERWPESSTRG